MPQFTRKRSKVNTPLVQGRGTVYTPLVKERVAVYTVHASGGRNRDSVHASGARKRDSVHCTRLWCKEEGQCTLYTPLVQGRGAVFGRALICIKDFEIFIWILRNNCCIWYLAMIDLRNICTVYMQIRSFSRNFTYFK